MVKDTQTFRRKQSVFGHFVEMGLKGLRSVFETYSLKIFQDFFQRSLLLLQFYVGYLIFHLAFSFNIMQGKGLHSSEQVSVQS